MFILDSFRVGYFLCMNGYFDDQWGNKWDKDNWKWRNHIIKSQSHDLYNVYHKIDNGKEILGTLNQKYLIKRWYQWIACI